MPKTRDAFAFRDFAPERILQRRFFKDFYFDANKSDEEILQKFSATDSDSFEITQEKFDTMDDLLVRAVEYQKHIKRHGDRLTKYTRALEYKIATDETANIEVLRKRHKRVDELSMKYCGAVTAAGIASYLFAGIAVKDVGGLCQKIAKVYKELDGKIKSHYRKIFAERLKQARKELRLTQNAFGNLLGLTQRGVSNFENAIYEPSLAVLVKISEKLNRPVGWFLGVS